MDWNRKMLTQNMEKRLPVVAQRGRRAKVTVLEELS